MNDKLDGRRHLDWVSRVLESPEVRREFDREWGALSFTEKLAAIMEAEGITRAELASRLGRSRAYVTKALRREQNLTIKTMADLAWACGYEFHPELRKREVSWQLPKQPERGRVEQASPGSSVRIVWQRAVARCFPAASNHALAAGKERATNAPGPAQDEDALDRIAA